MNSDNCKIQRAYSNNPALALPGMAGKLLNTFLPMKEHFQFELFLRILFCNKTAKPSSLKRINQFMLLCSTLVQARRKGEEEKKRENTAGQRERKTGSWNCVFLTTVCFSPLCVTTSGLTWEVHHTGCFLLWRKFYMK